MSSVIRKYQRVVPDLEEVRRNKYKSVYIENAAIITKEGFHIDLHICDLSFTDHILIGTQNKIIVADWKSEMTVFIKDTFF